MRSAVLASLGLFALLLAPVCGWGQQQPQTVPTAGNQTGTHPGDQPDTRVDIPRTGAPEPPPIPPQFNAHFAGTWTGTLEAPAKPATGQAAAANSRQPSLLVMRPSPDGRAVNFDITTYDRNAPTGVASADTSLKEREILAFTGPTAILTGTSNAQNQAFRVEGMEAFTKTGYGTLVFTGPGKQDDAPVDLRMTLTLTPGTFTWLRESRPAGGQGEFTFGREYRFTRAGNAPS